MSENKVLGNENTQAAIKNNAKRFNLGTKDTAYIIALLLSSVLVSAFGVFGGFRGGFTVTAVITVVCMSCYLLGKGYKFKLFSTSCIVLGVLVSLCFLITSNVEVRFFSFISFILLFIVWCTSATRDSTNKSDTAFLRFITWPLYEAMENIPIMFFSVFDKEKQSNKTLGKAFLGIALAIPVLFIIIPLLMNSDEAFSGMIKNISERTVTILLRIGIGIIIAIFIVAYALTLKKDTEPKIKSVKISRMEATVIISFLSVLSICYLSYLFSQLAYFFDAFRGFLPEGYKFTVSAYARRGFFEMSVIAAINFAVILICRIFTKRENKKAIASVNALSVFIGAFTLMIIATALSKMFLYINSFGMTRLRITTSMFMLFLAVLFIALMIKLYNKKVSVIKTAFITAAIVLILLGCFNVNCIVAKYNYNAYKNKALNRIDVETIAELGDEGIPYLVKLTADEDINTAEYAAYKLSLAYENYYNIEYSEDNIELKERLYDEIGQFGLSRKKAYEELENYLEENPYILNYRNIYTNTETEENNIW